MKKRRLKGQMQIMYNITICPKTQLYTENSCDVCDLRKDKTYHTRKIKQRHQWKWGRDLGGRRLYLRKSWSFYRKERRKTRHKVERCQGAPRRNVKTRPHKIQGMENLQVQKKNWKNQTVNNLLRGKLKW